MGEHNDIRILFHPRIYLTSPYLPHQRWQVRISFGPKRFKTRIGSKVQSQAGMPVSPSSVFLLKRSVSNAQHRKGCWAESISDRSVSNAYLIQSAVTGRNACVTFVCLLIETERFKRTTSQRARDRKHFGPTACNAYVSPARPVTFFIPVFALSEMVVDSFGPNLIFSQAGMPVSPSSVFLLKRSVSNAQRRKGRGAERISDQSVSNAYRS